jgi:putative ABC transport system permease protein
LILIIAISNAAGLRLLAAEARATEMKIRAALGATPLRLLMDRLRETLLLATAAAAASIPFAWISTRLLLEIAQPPTDIPLALAAHFDGRVLGILFCAALLAALVSTFCKVPRSFVAASQIALATALAILGTNLATTLHDARSTPLGYRTDQVLTLTYDPAQLRYTEVQTRRFFADLLDRTRALPGVRSAALAQSIPMSYVSTQSNITTDTTAPPIAVFSNLVTPGYFDLMRIPILEGRAFNLNDTAASAPVAIVNQELARQAPINSAVLINGRWHTVVGVARTARYFHITEAPRAYLYLPYIQNFASRMTLFVETLGAPAEMARFVVDPNLPATDVRSLDASVWHTALMNVRTGLRAVELVGGAGLVLALAGLYSAVASAALRRRREIAIRMAIGSTRVQACAAIARTAIVVSLFSVKIGFVLSFLTTRLLGSLAPAVSVRPAVVAAMSVLVLALIAAIFPAWRAARADPAAVLRQS